MEDYLSRHQPRDANSEISQKDLQIDEDLSGEYRVKVYIQSPRAGNHARDALPEYSRRSERQREVSDQSSGFSSQESEQSYRGRSPCSTLAPSGAVSSILSCGDGTDEESNLVHVTFDTEGLIREIDQISEAIQADFLLDQEFDDAFSKRQKVFLKNLQGIQKAAIGVSHQLRKLQQKMSSEDCKKILATRSMSTTALSDLVHQYRNENEHLKSQLDELIEQNRKLSCANDNQEERYEILRRLNQKLKADLNEITQQFQSIAHKVDRSDNLERQNQILIAKLGKSKTDGTRKSCTRDLNIQRTRCENLKDASVGPLPCSRPDTIPRHQQSFETVTDEVLNLKVQCDQLQHQNCQLRKTVKDWESHTKTVKHATDLQRDNATRNVAMLLQRCESLENENRNLRRTLASTTQDREAPLPVDLPDQHVVEDGAQKTALSITKYAHLNEENDQLFEALLEEKKCTRSLETKIRRLECLNAEKSLAESPTVLKSAYDAWTNSSDLSPSKDASTSTSQPESRHTSVRSYHAQTKFDTGIANRSNNSRPSESRAVQAAPSFGTTSHSQHRSEIDSNYVATYNRLQTEYDVLVEQMEQCKRQLSDSQQENMINEDRIRELWGKIGVLQTMILGLKKRLKSQSISRPSQPQPPVSRSDGQKSEKLQVVDGKKADEVPRIPSPKRATRRVSRPSSKKTRNPALAKGLDKKEKSENTADKRPHVVVEGGTTDDGASRGSSPRKMSKILKAPVLVGPSSERTEREQPTDEDRYVKSAHKKTVRRSAVKNDVLAEQRRKSRQSSLVEADVGKLAKLKSISSTVGGVEQDRKKLAAAAVPTTYDDDDHFITGIHVKHHRSLRDHVVDAESISPVEIKVLKIRRKSRGVSDKSHPGISKLEETADSVDSKRRSRSSKSGSIKRKSSGKNYGPASIKARDREHDTTGERGMDMEKQQPAASNASDSKKDLEISKTNTNAAPNESEKSFSDENKIRRTSDPLNKKSRKLPKPSGSTDSSNLSPLLHSAISQLVQAFGEPNEQASDKRPSILEMNIRSNDQKKAQTKREAISVVEPRAEVASLRDDALLTGLRKTLGELEEAVIEAVRTSSLSKLADIRNSLQVTGIGQPSEKIDTSDAIPKTNTDREPKKTMSSDSITSRKSEGKSNTDLEPRQSTVEVVAKISTENVILKLQLEQQQQPRQTGAVVSESESEPAFTTWIPMTIELDKPDSEINQIKSDYQQLMKRLDSAETMLRKSPSGWWNSVKRRPTRSIEESQSSVVTNSDKTTVSQSKSVKSRQTPRLPEQLFEPQELIAVKPLSDGLPGLSGNSVKPSDISRSSQSSCKLVKSRGCPVKEHSIKTAASQIDRPLSMNGHRSSRLPSFYGFGVTPKPVPSSDSKRKSSLKSGISRQSDSRRPSDTLASTTSRGQSVDSGSSVRYSDMPPFQTDGPRGSLDWPSRIMHTRSVYSKSIEDRFQVLKLVATDMGSRMTTADVTRPPSAGMTSGVAGLAESQATLADVMERNISQLESNKLMQQASGGRSRSLTVNVKSAKRCALSSSVMKSSMTQTDSGGKRPTLSQKNTVATTSPPIPTSTVSSQDEQLRQISRQLSRLDRRVRQEARTIFKTFTDSLPATCSQESQLRKISRKITKLESQRSSAVSQYPFVPAPVPTVVSAGKDPQLRKISRKLAQLDQRVQEQILEVYGFMRKEIEQFQQVSSQNLERLQKDVRRLSKLQPKKTSTITTDTQTNTDKVLDTDKATQRSSSMPSVKQSKSSTRSKRTASAYSWAEIPPVAKRRPTSTVNDSSSIWHSEHVKLKWQMRNVRKLLDTRSDSGLPDSKISQDVLQGFQRLSEQLQNMKDAVIRNTFAGGDAALNRQLPLRCAPTECDLHLSLDELTHCQAQNKLLRQQLGKVQSKRRCGDKMSSSDIDYEGSSAGFWTDSHLPDCLNRLTESKAVNRKLCLKIKKLKVLLRKQPARVSSRFSDNPCEDISSVDIDGARDRCVRKLVQCSAENKRIRDRMAKIRRDLICEKDKSNELTQARDELSNRNGDLVTELEESTRKLFEASKEIKGLEYEIRKLQELDRCRQTARRAPCIDTSYLSIDNCGVHTPQSELAKESTLRTQLNARESEIRRLRKKLGSGLNLQQGQNSAQIDSRADGNYNVNRESVSQRALTRLRQRIAKQKRLICELKTNSREVLGSTSHSLQLVEEDNISVCKEQPILPRKKKSQREKSQLVLPDDPRCRRLQSRNRDSQDKACNDFFNEEVSDPGPQTVLDQAVALSSHLRWKNRRDFELYGDDRDLRLA